MSARIAAILLLALAGGCGDPKGEASLEIAPLEVDSAELEKLALLGYVDWSERLSEDDLARSGVTRASDRAYPGYNLYTSLPSREAHLVDMAGSVVHTWTAPADDARPWHHVEMTAKGELFGVNGGPLQKLDWSSRVLWQAPFRAHHDLDIAPDGTIYALGLGVRRVGEIQVPIIDDDIVVIRPDGTIVRTIAFSEVFSAVLPGARLKQIEAFLARAGLQDASEEELLAKRGWRTPDVFHANSIELLPRDVPRLGQAGDVLICMRSLDQLAVIDLDTEKATWSWGPYVLDHPHHATLLRDGRVSVFDNGWRRKSSRVLHIDPVRGIRWRYPKQPGPDFFSQRRGAAQQLPNGNVLITESQDGRVIEVDPDGQILWEFLNPEIDSESQRRARIYRMERIEASIVEPLLAAGPH